MVSARLGGIISLFMDYHGSSWQRCESCDQDRPHDCSQSAASRGPNLLRIIRLGRITRGLKLVRLLKVSATSGVLSTVRVS